MHSDSEHSIYSISASEAQEAAQSYRAVRGEITSIEDGDKSKVAHSHKQKRLPKSFLPALIRIAFSPKHGKGELVEEERPSLGLDEVLSAMLTCSRTCGGDEGQRYVASAIMACREKENGETTAVESKHLTTIWEFCR